MNRFLLLFSLAVLTVSGRAESPWPRHCIDDSFQGADGVRLGDFNGDGLPDVVTGWEESGVIRLYLHPGHSKAQGRWPSITVARSSSPEDAVPIDLDGDGILEIVSCHEGKQRQLLVHWLEDPKRLQRLKTIPDKESLSDWNTSRFEALDGVMWMFALPLEPIGGRTVLVVGAKGPKASITLLVSPQKGRRDLSRWTQHRLRDVGWIMSLRAVDMDGDGDQDIVFSDRKGDRRGAAWLEQPGDSHPKPSDWADSVWPEHAISGRGKEVMFLAPTASRCLVATRESHILDCRRVGDRWEMSPIANPENVPLGKAVERMPDDSLILTCNTHASSHSERPGLWQRGGAGQWSIIDPTPRVKFDRIELVDLDGDGDLDVMTCEERCNLGIIWYENPQHQ